MSCIVLFVCESLMLVNGEYFCVGREITREKKQAGCITTTCVFLIFKTLDSIILGISDQFHANEKLITLPTLNCLCYS